MGSEETSGSPYYESWWFEWLFIILCGALGWFLWSLMDHPFLDPAGESARYMELAKSLAEGQGYSLLHTETRLPYFANPPLYPAVLAGYMLIKGQTNLLHLIHPFKVLNMGLYLFSILLVYLFIKNHVRKPYPFIITVLYTLSPLTVTVAGEITSQMLYLNFSLLALLTLDKHFVEKKPDPTRWQLLWCCIWILAAILTRNIGFLLLASFFFLAFGKIGAKRSFIIVGVILACLLPWFLREVYYRNLYVGSATAQEDTSTAKEGVFKKGKKSVESTLVETTRSTVGDLKLDQFDGLLIRKLDLQGYELKLSDSAIVRWVVASLIALGVFYGFYQLSGIGSIYLATYLIGICFLPVEKGKALFPLVPFLLLYLYWGVMKIGEWFKQVGLPLSKIIVPLLTVLIILSSLGGNLAHLREVHLIQAYYHPEDLRSDQKGFLQAMRWIGSHTNPEAQIVSAHPSVTYLYTNRKSRAFLREASFDEQFHDLSRTNFILEEGNNDSLKNRLTPLFERNPQTFKLVYNDEAAQIRVWQVTSPTTGFSAVRS